MSTYQELQQSGKGNLSTTEISKIIKAQLKKEFPTCKFSVSTQNYSGGSAIHISLMESKIKIVKDFNDISEVSLIRKESDRYTKEQIKNFQESKHHQLNQYQVSESYDPNSWCNGVFLTEEGHNLLKRVVEISQGYNFDESDISTDYFFVNYYLHLNLGKWDKDFIQL